VVLHPGPTQAELACQVVGTDEAGEPRLGVRDGRDVGADREQVGVAPDVLGPELDLRPADVREVVADLERAEALRTRVEGSEGLFGAALTTDETSGMAEGPGRAVRHCRARDELYL